MTEHRSDVFAYANAIVERDAELDPIFATSSGIIDYDEFLRAPRAQLERIATTLELPDGEGRADAVSAYVDSFVDTTLRHSRFSLYDFDASPGITPLTSHAYRWLFELAADRLGHDAPEFWSAWETLVALVRTQIDRAEGSRCS